MQLTATGGGGLLRLPATPVEWGVYVLALYGALAVLLRLLRAARTWWGLLAPPPAISFLLMVRNQAHQIEGILRSLTALMRTHRADYRCELVVVDHCSTDETPRIVERLARELHDVRLVRMNEHMCRGQSACEVGMFACQSRVMVCLDLLGASEARVLLRSLATLVGHHGPLTWL